MPDLAQEQILITGGDGFRGRHLQAELVRRGVGEGNLRVPLIQDCDRTRLQIMST